jgi:hypothetical protein
MPNNSQYLAVVGYAPTLQVTNVGILPEIQVRFNIPVDTTLVNTSEGLNRYVVLVNVDTDDTVAVEYVGWDSVNRILTFQPETALEPHATYQVTLRKTLQSSEGRSMTQDRVWVFGTAAAEVTQVVLRSPGDSTAWRTAPRLEWSGVSASGSVTYDLQLHTDWEFHAPLFWATTLTTSGSGGILAADIATALDERSTYFWRVRARTTGTSGEWCDPWSFYVGRPLKASPDTRLTYQPDEPFRFQLLYPPKGTPHLAAWPQLQIRLTQDVDADTVTGTSVYLYRQPVDGRSDKTGGAVSATLTTVGKVITVTPLDTLEVNSRYTLVVGDTLESTSGEVIEEGGSTYFTSTYRPLYGGVRTVRSMLGGFIADTSDDEIFFQLWQASLKVNELFITRWNRIRRGILFDEVVNYQPPANTWGMKEYAELECAINLLESHYWDLAQEAGRDSALATFQSKLDVAILPEIRKRISELKLERDQVAATFLFGATVPRPGVKSQAWSPDNLGLAIDQSYQPRKKF